MRMVVFGLNRHVSTDENSQIMLSQGKFSGLQVCQKCFCGQGSAPEPTGGAYSTPRPPIGCLFVYLNTAGLRQGPAKKLLGSWKVLEFL